MSTTTATVKKARKAPKSLEFILKIPNVLAIGENSMIVKGLSTDKDANKALMSPIREALTKAGMRTIATTVTTDAGASKDVACIKVKSGIYEGSYTFKLEKVSRDVDFDTFEVSDKGKARVVGNREQALNVPDFIRLITGGHDDIPFWKEFNVSTFIQSNADGTEETIVALNTSDDKGIPASAKPQKHMSEKTSWTLSDFVNYALAQAARSFVANSGKVLSEDFLTSKMDREKREKRERSELDEVTGDAHSTKDTRSGYAGTAKRIGVPVLKSEDPVVRKQANRTERRQAQKVATTA